MAKEDQTATFELVNLFRGYIEIDHYVTAALLLADTKEELDKREIVDESDVRSYETMLSVADRLGIYNPFKDSLQFSRIYKAYQDFNVVFDLEILMAASAREYRYPTISSALFNEYSRHFKLDADTVLIAEGEKFIPNLKRLIDEYPDCNFTITTEPRLNFQVFSRMFAGYENVKIINASIYQYGFTNNRYDLIFSVPNFGTRNLADDENFMCRDQDAVALENLLLHTTAGSPGCTITIA